MKTKKTTKIKEIIKAYYVRFFLLTMIIFTLGIIGNSVYHSVKVSERQDRQMKLYFNKMNELRKEHVRVLDLARKTDGVSTNEYFVYEGRELEELKEWEETHDMTDKQYEYLVNMVKTNAKALEDSYFNQPTSSSFK